jgi:hypothetical protein
MCDLHLYYFYDKMKHIVIKKQKKGLLKQTINTYVKSLPNSRERMAYSPLSNRVIGNSACKSPNSFT